MSKINKKYTLSVKGILINEEGRLAVEVEDVEDPILLIDLVEDFVDKEVNISIGYSEDSKEKHNTYEFKSFSF